MANETNITERSGKAGKFAAMLRNSNSGPIKPRIMDLVASEPTENEVPQIDSFCSLEGAKLINVNIDQLQSAPANMNFFHKQSEKVVLDLSVSLVNDGQFSPIIIRELPDNPDQPYQILAGDTRTAAAKYAVGGGYDKLKILDAYYFPAGTCDDVRAMRIIIHSNLQGRGGRGLLPDEKFHCFVWEYLDELSSNKNSKAAEITQTLMDRYGVKKTQAYTYRAIAKNLSSEFIEAFREGKLSIRDAEALASFERPAQEMFYAHLDEIRKIPLKKLRKKSPEEIQRILESPEPETPSRTTVINENDDEITYQVTIPRSAIETFQKSIYRITRKFNTALKK